jgi:uncharacterized protein (DUF433 family)
VFDRITFNRSMMGGACVRGMRIPICVILRQIAQGATVDEVRAGYWISSGRISSRPWSMRSG